MTINHSVSRYAANLVLLKGHFVLQVSFRKSDVEFTQLLFRIGPVKGRKLNTMSLTNLKGPAFHQDKPRHRDFADPAKMVPLRRDVVINALYSRDMAPRDYHLFRVLQNVLN